MIGAIIGAAIGVLLAFFLDIHIPPAYSIYMATAIAAALDSVVGAASAICYRKFELKVLVTGILTNAIIAAFLVFIGKLIGLELSLAVILLFGTRILKNFSLIRRFLLNKYKKKVTIDIEE